MSTEDEKLRVIITGATGMVGEGALFERARQNASWTRMPKKQAKR